MKARIQTNNGGLEIPLNVTKRYKISRRLGTTDQDEAQFWTWVKYEMRVDYNNLQKVIGLSEYNLNKIRKQWGNKFYFEV